MGPETLGPTWQRRASRAALPFRAGHVGPVSLAGGSARSRGRRHCRHPAPLSMTRGPRADAAHVTVGAARGGSGRGWASSPAALAALSRGPKAGPLGGAAGPSGGKASRFDSCWVGAPKQRPRSGWVLLLLIIRLPGGSRGPRTNLGATRLRLLLMIVKPCCFVRLLGSRTGKEKKRRERVMWMWPVFSYKI